MRRPRVFSLAALISFSACLLLSALLVRSVYCSDWVLYTSPSGRTYQAFSVGGRLEFAYTEAHWPRSIQGWRYRPGGASWTLGYALLLPRVDSMGGYRHRVSIPMLPLILLSAILPILWLRRRRSARGRGYEVVLASQPAPNPEPRTPISQWPMNDRPRK